MYNKDRDRSEMRALEIERIKNRQKYQNECNHYMNNTGVPCIKEYYAFHCLKLSTGELVGVCPYCQLVISSLNPEDHKYFLHDPNKLAESGIEVPMTDDEKPLAIERYHNAKINAQYVNWQKWYFDTEDKYRKIIGSPFCSIKIE